MNENHLTNINEHPIFRFFCHYPTQLKAIARAYLVERFFGKVHAFLERTNGFATLILDEHTLPLVSNLFTNTTLTSYRFVLKELLASSRKPQPKMLGVYFISGTLKSLQAVAKDFGYTGSGKIQKYQDLIQMKRRAITSCCTFMESTPKAPYAYKGCMVFTPSAIPVDAVSFVSSSGLAELLPKQSVISLDMNFVARMNRFISMNQPEGFLVAFSRSNCTNADVQATVIKEYITRTSQKLWSYFNIARMGVPEIRYHYSPNTAEQTISRDLAAGFLDYCTRNPVTAPPEGQQRVNTTLIILDRAIDPLPLLAHHGLFGDYVTDYLDICDDISTFKHDNLLVEVDLAETSEGWVSTRFLTMMYLLQIYVKLLQSFRSMDPMEGSAGADGNSEERRITATYGKSNGKSILVPKYTIVESSVLNVPYRISKGHLDTIINLMSKYQADIANRNFEPLVISLERKLKAAILDPSFDMRDLQTISVNESTMEFRRAFMSLSSPTIDSTIAIRILLYLVLVSRKCKGKVVSTLTDEFVDANKPLSSLLSLSYTVCRSWAYPDNIASIRTIWSEFVYRYVSDDFITLNQLARKSSLDKKRESKDDMKKLAKDDKRGRMQTRGLEQVDTSAPLLENNPDAEEATLFTPVVELIYKAFREQQLPETFQKMFPIIEGYSFPAVERRRRGAAMRKDMFMGAMANSAARFYPETPDGRNFLGMVEKRETAAFRAREKVYIYIIGGATSAEISAAYRVTGDSAIPEPSPLNEAYWQPTLGEFDCILMSDDLYTPSRFIQRLCALDSSKPSTRFSSYDDIIAYTRKLFT